VAGEGFTEENLWQVKGLRRDPFTRRRKLRQGRADLPDPGEDLASEGCPRQIRAMP
jgi:hypothetical protein